ncbi:YdcF family protein [Microbacterium sp. X-17]|uniref:YdcF family protein n=1 Tax=Microbacterium sp. X-17 TaxID=3144404 RepID=UPI0031F56E72
MDADPLEREWRRLRRRSRWAIAVVAVVLVALTLPTLAVAFPAPAAVGPADVIYVIGPPTPPRIALEARLRARGIAPAALISVPATGPLSEGGLTACRDTAVTCRVAVPFTTKGEALMLTRYAMQHPASRAVVITFTPHVDRTRYVFAKCYAGQVTVVGVDERMSFREWVYQVLYQSAAFVKAWITPCAQLDD